MNADENRIARRIGNFRSHFQLQLAYHTLWKACGSAGSSHLLAGSGIDSELFYKWQDAHNPNRSYDLIRRRVKTAGKLQHRQNLYNLWDLHIQRDTALISYLPLTKKDWGLLAGNWSHFRSLSRLRPHISQLLSCGASVGTADALCHQERSRQEKTLVVGSPTEVARI